MRAYELSNSVVFRIANDHLPLQLNLPSAAPFSVEHWRHLHQFQTILLITQQLLLSILGKHSQSNGTKKKLLTESIKTCLCTCYLSTCCFVGFVGALLGTYEDNRFKSESKKLPALKCIDFLGLRGGPELEKKLKYIEDVCSRVHFIAAACENILTVSNGKTIEVNNNDAEGRLTLADALVYACNQDGYSPTKFFHCCLQIVDLATLTGACIVALGPSIAGIFIPSDELEKEGQQIVPVILKFSYQEGIIKTKFRLLFLSLGTKFTETTFETRDKGL
ncbi:hypothetical protein LXL04_030989 [Taraxacum kok-saghyz]